MLPIIGGSTECPELQEHQIQNDLETYIDPNSLIDTVPVLFSGLRRDWRVDYARTALSLSRSGTGELGWKTEQGEYGAERHQQGHQTLSSGAGSGLIPQVGSCLELDLDLELQRRLKLLDGVRHCVCCRAGEPQDESVLRAFSDVGGGKRNQAQVGRSCTFGDLLVADTV